MKLRISAAFAVCFLSLFFFTIKPTVAAAINKPPTANSNSVTTNEDTPLTITLTGSDPEGASLTYSIAYTTTRGTLTGSGNQWTYTPTANLNGTDSFKFKVSDGNTWSRLATVTITVNAVNDAPVATSASYTYNEDTTTSIRLQSTDVDGDALTYQITQPQLATATLNGDTVTYALKANVNGTDSFTFTASDGKATSAAATISLTINAVNDAPTVVDKSVSTNEDTSLVMSLSSLGASDVEGDALTATVSGGVHGTFSVSGSNINYTPNADYNGSDFLTYRAYDGTSYSSATATVSITVNAVNDAPVATDVSAQVISGKTVNVAVSATDVEGSSLTYAIASAPSHGTASISGNTITFKADSNYTGADSLTFVASDGSATSSPATVSFDITTDDVVVHMNTLELIPGVTTTVASDKISITMASNSTCYNTSAAPIFVQADNGDDLAVGTINSICDGYMHLDNYTYFVDTTSGKAYRPIAEREMVLDPDSQDMLTTGGGLIIGSLRHTAIGEDDPDATTGGDYTFDGVTGEMNYYDVFKIRIQESSPLFVDGDLLVVTSKDKKPTCQDGNKIDAENCGQIGVMDPNDGTLFDSTLTSTTYEASTTARMTRGMMTDQKGNVIYDRVAWGTGLATNNDAPTTAAFGACSAHLADTDTLFNGNLSGIDFLNSALGQDSAIVDDPGDAGCVKYDSNNKTTYSSIIGDMTIGFNPTTKHVTYWGLGYFPDVAGSSNTWGTQYDENLNPVCEFSVNSGAYRSPWSGNNGVVIDRNGVAYTSATYRDSSNVQRTGILKIDPTTCAVIKLLELNYAAIGNSSFSGVSLVVKSDDGQDAVMAAVAGNLYVITMDGAYNTYPLASSNSDAVLAAPVVQNGRVVTISKNNVMTLLNLGLTYGDHFWPRPGKDNFNSRTVEITEN